MAEKIETTLAERGSRYGDYAEHARITQNIKRAMQDSPNWRLLDDDMREALEMIAHKAGRILNGDPGYHDSWHDIIGYTKLVADRLLTDEADRSAFQAAEVTIQPHIEEWIARQSDEPGSLKAGEAFREHAP